MGIFWAQAPGDSIAEARVAGVLQSAKKRMIIRGESSTTFEDLRLVPSILIGAFNNNWDYPRNRPDAFSVSIGYEIRRMVD